MIIDPHVFTTFCAARTAWNLIELLPETDIVDELWTIITIQLNILDTMMDGSHYGDNNLEMFLDYLEDVDEEIKTIGVVDE